MDSFKSTVAEKIKFNHMWDIAAHNNKKIKIVKTTCQRGKVTHYIGDVR